MTTHYAMSVLIASFLFCLMLPSVSHARSSRVRQHFLRSKGLNRTPLGCQVDHVISLHLGGTDTVENMCLICGDKLRVKEWAERHGETLRYWLKDNQIWLKDNGCRYEWNPLIDHR